MLQNPFNFKNRYSYIYIEGPSITEAEMDGPGGVQHIRMMPIGDWRYSI
jgi:hypothetical protein